MAIQPENVADLTADTLKDLGRFKFTDLSSRYQRHVVMKNLARKHRITLESGVGIQFNILTGQSNAAQNMSPGQADVVGIVDGMIQASTVWRGSGTNYPLVGQYVSMNREPARIVDYVKQQRLMAMISFVELMEANFWSAPSSTDSKTPYGLPYWVTKNATRGLNGGTLSGFSTVAGVNTTTYDQWNNWTDTYTNVTRDDFIRNVRNAATKTDWQPTVDGIPSPGQGDDYGFYTNYAVIQPLEEAVEAQNDNLGHDVASMDGKTLFRRVPVTWVPYLERDTTNPFYGINWGWFHLYILRDWWMAETVIPHTSGQHTVASHFLDSVYQFVTKSRREHFCVSNGTTYTY